MVPMSEHELYPIGDAARRSGLSVSAVRFYADAGIITPTDRNGTGHRLYDIGAIARLELVRTLRELDTDLDEIRRLLEGGTTLHDLLTTHLAIVERQEHTLRARRAVLRTLIEQGGGTAAQADLMHRLVSMTDEEREQTVDDFWNGVGEGLDVPEGFVDRLRAMRPVLPAEPTADQLKAWIELADLLRDPGFRTAVRDYLRLTYSTDIGRTVASPDFQEFVHESGSAIMKEVMALRREGEPPRSPRAQEAVVRFMEAANGLSGTPLTAQVRDRMADGFRRLVDIERMIAEEDAASEGPVYDDTQGRYLALVARINGTGEEQESDPLLYSWLADAMAAPAGG
ncbi:DNA-binding transcriptional regulator, MerR family [Nocardiopsis flavescens]|uniref:DNA-binding transcriptional regulator, MerR family n=2 Tax=Nocardiopsis flavescens TaxID=758803 RepID=A0A1M6CLY3_9ACTN|nr:DNA-binding transcriptional regulator, MerR family [Nocardiopsis flavescens]